MHLGNKNTAYLGCEYVFIYGHWNSTILVETQMDDHNWYTATGFIHQYVIMIADFIVLCMQHTIFLCIALINCDSTLVIIAFFIFPYTF